MGKELLKAKIALVGEKDISLRTRDLRAVVQEHPDFFDMI